MPFPDPDVKYSYADYLTWPKEQRWELIEGVPHAMAAPSTRHQRFVRKLTLQIGNFLEEKDCEVFPAPFSVYLKHTNKEDTVVEPDLSVVCDPAKLDDRGCKGAPDLIIEVLSPTTARHDRVLKFNKYLEAKVMEYWIVDPERNVVEVFLLRGNIYSAQAYLEDDVVPVWVLPGLVIDFKKVFE